VFPDGPVVPKFGFSPRWDLGASGSRGHRLNSASGFIACYKGPLPVRNTAACDSRPESSLHFFVLREIDEAKQQWPQSSFPMNRSHASAKTLMKSIVFFLGAFVLCGAMLSAHETTPVSEAGASYPWLHVNSANYDRQITGNSGSGYFEYNLNKTMGLVADFGGYANTRTVSMTTY
jgi:hypothetical protein